MKRRLGALLAVLCLIAGTAAAFSDVKESDWYYGAVEYAVQAGLMKGASGDVFLPGDTVTRGMTVTVLYRMEGSPAVGGGVPFPDVAAGEWYSDAVAWAKSTGVATGYGTGTFGPNDAMTREQLAVFLWRYAKYKGTEIANGVLGGYCDAGTVSTWALEGMTHAVGAGLIAGKDGNRLDPDGIATRAELATILQRLATPAAG